MQCTPAQGDPVSKREDAKLARLAAKNAARESRPASERHKQYDPTLAIKPERDVEGERLFKEMKKREF
jgi:hypothetical protein